MTSERKILSNRKNALRSSGARTVAGRRHSSRNARKHGLAVPIAVDQMWAERIESLTRDLAGEHAGLWRLQQAREIAQAEFDLIRVRIARTGLFARPPIARLCSSRGRNQPNSADGAGLAMLDAVASVVEQAKALDRYERRALSRRDRALRQFTKTPHF